MTDGIIFEIYLRKDMKSFAKLIILGLLVTFAPACLPVDEEVDPGDPVEKFIGKWKVAESCHRLNYDVDILQDPGNSVQVLLYNFGNPGSGYDPAVGLVLSNSIRIEAQTIGEGWTVSGKGTYQSNGSITWDYTLVVSSDEYTCTATFTKYPAIL